jgi:hypothetical protein
MHLGKTGSLKKRLQEAGGSLEGEMTALYEYNYTTGFDDNNSQIFATNYELYFFDDYKNMISGQIKR